ncbi:MAG: IS982 family transposase, partial [Bacteroides stercoris]|nr:IS982 family transposase [Bacteroides stercoris]MDY4225408.1 IS982 family transposase [Bacteroides uniformis]MCI7346861.1 IS982 family transposase [Bacteroides stercoris]MCI7348277.1 IS982 family transposase [Bacteroides stercoris]MCI7348907.1 IS982 family transposase [Bacteroides stercoris]
MYERLRISLIFSKLEVIKLLIYIHRMHNLYAIFAK